MVATRVAIYCKMFLSAFENRKRGIFLILMGLLQYKEGASDVNFHLRTPMIYFYL